MDSNIIFFRRDMDLLPSDPPNQKAFSIITRVFGEFHT
jgi:hypothetical protein